MAHAHSHSHEISGPELQRIKDFIASDPSRDATVAERVLSELAFYSQNVKSKIGLWSMGELDRFVTEYLPGHIGDAALSAAAPELIIAFAKWLKSGAVPTCDVSAIEKRMRKLKTR